MRNWGYTIGFFIRLVLLVALFLEGCAAPGTNYKREYGKVWKETIQSEAWKISIVETDATPPDMDVYYTSAEQTDRGIIETVPHTSESADFAKKYYLMVTRAYFRIISEAEAAEGRLKNEYITSSAKAREHQDAGNKTARQSLETIRRKYDAHRGMLEGLKSWNILSKFGTDDLRFFMAENEERVVQMFQDGQQEERIIYYLIYKLADLYHFDE